MQWKGNGKGFWHILYINANMQCEVILFVCASVRVCVCLCVRECVHVLIYYTHYMYGRRQKKVPPFDPHNGRPYKKKRVANGN